MCLLVWQTMAYSTMAEKEMLSISTDTTEQSYRSGRGFLVTSPGDINGRLLHFVVVAVPSG